MKTNRIFLLLMGIVLWVIGGIKVNANETMDTLNDYEKIIEQYSDCVNERDIYNYIDLFTKDNRKNMQNHVKINGEKDFSKIKYILFR